jgi:ribosomal protein L37AE/L43A
VNLQSISKGSPSEYPHYIGYPSDRRWSDGGPLCFGAKLIALLEVDSPLTMVKRTQTQCRACHEFGHNSTNCDDWICNECDEEFGSETARMQHGDSTGHEVEHD